MSEKIYRVQMNSKGMPNFSTAEEIIRCGERKWFDSKGHCMRLTAEYGTYEDVRTDDFCSYGEREGE